ncbi:hypothetical protein OJHNALOF_01335 [Oceanimonas sp. MB9]|nr:hypothetical protein [Oceanimonas sp. MB9]
MKLLITYTKSSKQKLNMINRKQVAHMFVIKVKKASNSSLQKYCQLIALKRPIFSFI